MNRGARLLELQDIENVLRDHITAYKQVQKALNGSSPVRQARQAYEEATAAEKEARARQQQVSLEWKSVIEKVESEEKRLYSGEIRNPKELSDLELSVEMLKKQRERLEEQALTLIEEVDHLAEQSAQAKAKLEEVEAEDRKRHGALEKQEHQLKRCIVTERRRREAILSTIDEDALEQYRYVQRLKNDTHAVATLSNGVCSACHIEVSTSKRDSVERADKHRLVTCGNCGRILVI